jgi:Ca-activated chloride channel family protein
MGEGKPEKIHVIVNHWPSRYGGELSSRPGRDTAAMLCKSICDSIYLKESKAKSKVVILLTDGSNNRGDISPMTAAEIARSLGIRVYTVGVGTNKVAPYPMPVAGGIQYVNIPVEIDTKTLSEIAAATEGDFYRATNTKELRNIYKEIDQLEKSKLNVKTFSKRYEAYQPFALAAVLALLLEILLRITIFRRIP